MRHARVGWHGSDTQVQALPGFKPAKSMVFAGVYPEDGSQYESVRIALNKLTLNDASISVQQEVSAALGAGFRCAASAHMALQYSTPWM
jgi:translation elongation factor EF-4